MAGSVRTGSGGQRVPRVPDTYLNAVRQSLHDWIAYYEARRVSAELSSRGGRQSYFAR